MVRLNPPLGTKLFQFHGEIYEKSGKMLKTIPLLMDLNPTSRNPESAPQSILNLVFDTHTHYNVILNVNLLNSNKL